MGSATPPPQVGGARALPNLGVPFYLRVHPLTQNYTRFDVVTHGKGRVFRKSATPLHWHKCVARFVSNSNFFNSVAPSDL